MFAYRWCSVDCTRMTEIIVDELSRVCERRKLKVSVGHCKLKWDDVWEKITWSWLFVGHIVWGCHLHYKALNDKAVSRSEYAVLCNNDSIEGEIRKYGNVEKEDKGRIEEHCKGQEYLFKYIVRKKKRIIVSTYRGVLSSRCGVEQTSKIQAVEMNYQKEQKMDRMRK